MKFSKKKLEEVARERPPGYLEEVLAVSVAEGDYVIVPKEEYWRLVWKYGRGQRAEGGGQRAGGRGQGVLIGDWVARWAAPVKRWLTRWGLFPDECGCDSRRLWLNGWHRWGKGVVLDFFYGWFLWEVHPRWMAMRTWVNEFKQGLTTEDTDGHRDGGQITIAGFNVAVTNICNAKCSFCAYDKVDMPRGVMTSAVFEDGAARWRAYGGTSIDLTPPVGDPLIDPGLAYKLRFAKSLGIRTSITTNAILLKGRSALLLDAGLDELFVSLPSMSRVVYQEVYGVDKSVAVNEGLEEFLALNKRRGEPCAVRLRFRNSELPSTIIQHPEFIRIVEPYLSARVKVSFTFAFDNWGGLIEDSHLSGVMRFKKPIESNLPCVALFGVSVRFDGTLRACSCRFVKGDCDDLTVGHIRDGFEAASRNSARIISEFTKGNRPETCRKCTLYTPVGGRFRRPAIANSQSPIAKDE